MQATGKIWVFYNAASGKQTKPMSTLQAQMTVLSFKTKELKSIFVWSPGWPEWLNIETFLKSEQNIFVLTHPPKPQKNSEKNPSPSFHVRHKSNDETPTVVTKTDITQTDVTQTLVTDTGLGETTDIKYTRVEVSEQESAGAPTDYGYYHQDFNGHDLDLSKIRKLPKMKPKSPKKSDPLEDKNRRGAIRHNFKLEVLLITKEKSFRTFSKNISLGGTLLEDLIPTDFLNKPFDLIIINRFETDPQKRRLLFKAKIVGDVNDPRRLMFMETDPNMMARLDVLLKAYNTYQEQMRKQVG